MICKNCGKEIADNSVFCTECGARVSPEEPKTIQAEMSAEQTPPEVPAEQAASEAPAEQAQAPEEYKTSPEIPTQQPTPKTPSAQIPASYPPTPEQVPAQQGKAVSTGLFLLMMILGMIPVLGLLMHIITLAAAKIEHEELQPRLCNTGHNRACSPARRRGCRVYHVR